MKKTSSKNRRNIFLLAVLLILAAAAALWTAGPLRQLLQLNTKPATHITGGQATKGEKTTTDKPATSGSDNTSAPGTVKNETAPSTVLISPTGTFVSSHKATLNTTLSSACNTSAGATCEIVFSSGGTAHTLSTETTDLGGAAYWNTWTPANIGLTPGTWQIKAIATLGNQTLSSTDAMSLEITQ